MYECEQVEDLAKADLPAQEVRAIVSHKVGNALVSVQGGTRRNAQLLPDLLAFVRSLDALPVDQREAAQAVIVAQLEVAIDNNASAAQSRKGPGSFNPL